MFINSKPFYIKTPLTEEEVKARFKVLFRENRIKTIEKIDDYPFGGTIHKGSIQLFRLPLYIEKMPFRGFNKRYINDYGFAAIELELSFNKITEGIIEAKFKTKSFRNFYFFYAICLAGFFTFNIAIIKSFVFILFFAPFIILLIMLFILQKDHVEQMRIEISIFLEGEIVETPSSEA